MNGVQSLRQREPHPQSLPVVALCRLQTGVQGTFGLLVLPGAAPLITAELPWRGNRQRMSCIPSGAYRCSWRRSPRFGWVYSVDDVPGRASILIHPGNVVGDTEIGLDTHSQGCILVGERYGRVRNTQGRMQRAVLVSRPAARTLATVMGGRPFTLEISGC